jgi:hypothetical protein
MVIHVRQGKGGNVRGQDKKTLLGRQGHDKKTVRRNPVKAIIRPLVPPCQAEV